MMVSPLRTEFFAQSTIDKDNMSVPPRKSSRRLLSSPLTSIFSRIHIGSSLRRQQPGTKDTMSIEYQTVGCQVSSKDFPHRLSISTDSSEESDSWLTEDLFGRDGRSDPLGNSHSSYGSTLSQLEDEERIWSLWDANKDEVTPDLLYYPIKPLQILQPAKPAQPAQPAQPLAHRKLLPSRVHQDRLDSEHNSQLKRSPAIRSPQRPHHIDLPQSPPSLPSKPKYSAFPLTPTIPETPEPEQNHHMNSNSWPLPNEPRGKPQLRSRAYTTPTPTHRVNRPSNLSSCTTVNYNPQYSPTVGLAMPMYMRSAPTSPTFVPQPERGLMDLMVETSAFSDDEDDEEKKDVPTFVLAMKSALHLGRGHSTSEGGEKLPVQKPKRKSSKRTLTGALNSIFKSKKGATL